MKNYKKGILTLTILSAMSLMAADDKTIYVNTFDDEDGENTSKCSLREAVTAASTHKSYGGCATGQTYTTVTNVIQLEAGEYKLNKELQPLTAIVIQGKAPVDYSRPDVLTNAYPAQTDLKTVINGQGKSRIINTTSTDKPSLALNNLLLKDGYSSTLGGALYLGGATTLTNVSIQNAKAQVGGAIYLNDVSSSLTITSGNYQQNDAVQGSIFAMTCSDNLIDTTRNVTVESASFLNNGSANSQSAFSFCGQPTASFTANTITNNSVNLNTGSLIQFSSKTPQGKTYLSKTSSLTLLSNTIVSNSAWATLLYNSFGTKVLSNNILAFNGAGKSCRYADGDVADVKTTNFALTNNALVLTAGDDQCDLPTEVVKAIKDTTLDLSGVAFSTVLSTLQNPSEYTSYMYMYFPKDNGTKTDLVDTASMACSARDQRGVSRTASINSTGQTETSNTCDIGATEVLRLTAGNLTAVNQSIVTILGGYQKEYDTFKSLIENKDTNPDFLPYYRAQETTYDNNLKYTKSDQKYRTVFVDPFATNLPDETVLANGGREIKHLSTDNYDVTVSKLGTGKLDANNQFLGKDDANLRCEWDANLKKILVYRVDDAVTPTGDYEFCSYTLTLKNSNPVKSSSAYVVTNFINIAPIANDVSYTIQHGGSQKIDVNLLENANDDGDGLTSALVTKPNKSKFYLDESGQDLAIRITSVPDPVSVTADRSGPCPGNDKKLTCYGGKIHIQLKNTLDPFGYKFKYVVYDADSLVSNEATVTLNNTDSSPSSVRESGGGSFEWFSIFGLFGLLGLRLRKQKMG